MSTDSDGHERSGKETVRTATDSDATDRTATGGDAADGQATGGGVTGDGGALFTRAGILRGVRATALVSLPVIPFGMAFGLAAGERGLSPELAMAMSALVFAGLSQLAALDIWAAPLPVLPIILITFMLNTRHLLYGAAMSPWTSGLRPWQKYTSAALMADINWAMSMQVRERGERDVGYLLGGGIVLWSVWQISTGAGIILGDGLGDPKRFGLDAVVIALFSTTLVGLWRGRDDVLPWIAAAAASLIAYELLPKGWHILVGAFAGGALGVLRFAR